MVFLNEKDILEAVSFEEIINAIESALIIDESSLLLIVVDKE